jgi:tetratricopeptide (TPR) repeat protein
MNLILGILLIVIVLAVVVFLVITLSGKLKGGGGGTKMKGRDAILRDANKRLSQNPRDPEALQAMADVYFQEQTWDKAFKTYEVLAGMGSGNSNVNEFEANLRCAISALRLGLNEEAYKSFAVARSLKTDDFEVNYNLGYLEYLKKSYERAIQLLMAARSKDPEHAPTLRYLGLSFFMLKKYKEAAALIRKAIDLAPDDKESLYAMAECYYELNQTEQALRIFGHLRPDPTYGPNACLFAGTINTKHNQFEKAIENFEIGLKHQVIKPEIEIELKYRLATVYLKEQQVAPAIQHLRDIIAINPGYKDAAPLLSRYQELNANRNMQLYLMAPSADFIALCRKIVMSYIPNSKVKITNISVNKNEWADLLAEIDTPKWSDLVMFRFIRTQGSVGELVVRDFHSHLKEVKAGKGYCMAVGSYTEEAKRYTEARLIDLIDKDKLAAILNTVDAKAAKMSSLNQKKKK